MDVTDVYQLCAIGTIVMLVDLYPFKLQVRFKIIYCNYRQRGCSQHAGEITYTKLKNG